MKAPRFTTRWLIGFAGLVFATVIFATVAEGQFTNYSLIHAFNRGNARGALPYAGLREGSDGALYGMASEGGYQNAGTLFRLNRDGSGFAVLHHFGAFPDDGRNPKARLIEGGDGCLYGVTTGGGATNAGTVFRVSKSGSAYQILHSFTVTPTDGASPSVGLLEASDGRLYGACGIVGAGLVGTIFRMDKDGSNFAVIRQFWGPDEPYEFRGALAEGTNGMLYAASLYGGDYGPGTVFRLNKDGSDYSIVRHFGDYFADGLYPSSGVLLASDGLLYGHTSLGGPVNGGITYVVGHDGVYSGAVHSFTSASGKNPRSALIEGRDGYLYGTTDRGGTNDSGVVFKMKKDTTGYTVLHHFNYRTGDGVRVSDGLLQGSDGLLYGTTSEGGRADKGTIFRLQTNGFGYEVLFHFDGEGAEPAPTIGSLVAADDGRLYGAAHDGGAFLRGALFSVNKDGSDFISLYSFEPPNDVFLSARNYLAIPRSGNLYGVTAYGGVSNAGTLFRVGRNGNDYTVLHHFTYAPTNGAVPGATLLEGADGFLYGSTSSGGSNGFGNLFRIATNGAGFVILRTFTSASNDVRWPSALLEGSDGFLYGVARTATSSLTAAVFKLNKNGSESATLAYVTGGEIKEDNQEQRATLMEASDGWLYGSAGSGGTTNAGFLFKASKDGNGYAVIHNFLGGPEDGSNPRAALVEGRDGSLYGTTYSGGAFYAGTLFKINKDGGGYAMLRSCPTGGEGGYRPELPLIAGSDGAFYGAMRGSAVDPLDVRATAGFIFRLGHAVGLRFAQGVPNISATGVPGYAYELERSPDLSLWTNTQTFALPANGVFEFADSNAPPANAFYRLRVR